MKNTQDHLGVQLNISLKKNMKEIWKVFKDTRYATHGFLWEVSDQGQVKRNGELFECKLDKGGYKSFAHCGVHRAVAMLFIPNPNNYNEVDHINGDRLDNRVINLQWCTHKENCNNPITLKRKSEANKGKNKNKHRVYHDDGTWHMEEIL